MLFADLALARRLEAAETSISVEVVAAYQQIRPRLGATAEKIAGTTAIYTGVDSPLTQVFGLGLYEPVTDAHLDQLEAFFFSRQAGVNIELCPLADPGLALKLAERNYRVIEFSNVLVRELRPLDAEMPPPTEVTVHQLVPEKVDQWALTVAKSFVPDGSPSADIIDLFQAVFHMRTSTCFLAEIEGKPVGGGMLCIHDGIGGLAATSTLEGYRNRGVQSALISARIAEAAGEGCEMAMVTTGPGTTSQRNVERFGFRVVYTRTKFFRPFVTV